jgi:hypothetical protein
LRAQNSFEKRRRSPSKLCSKMVEFVIHYDNEYCSLLNSSFIMAMSTAHY